MKKGEKNLLSKSHIHEIVDADSSNNRLSRGLNKFLIVLILLNALSVILESVPNYSLAYGAVFRVFEFFSVSVFTVEYIVRVWTCNLNPKFKSPFRGRLSFMTSPMAIIDLLAILPFFLPMLFPFDLRSIRILRMVRMVRILKLGRYSKVIQKLGRVLVAKREELTVTLGIVFLLLIVSSTLMYYIENPSQPEAFSSIPATMWWGVATLTTVGYGDVYPITTLGKVLGAFIAILGVGIVALPTGIIGSGFMEELQGSRKEKITCPNCGEEIGE